MFFRPEFFIEAANNIPANPLQTPAHIAPSWYFLPFYAILRAIPDLLGGVVVMTLSILVFALMPYLDRSKIPGGSRYRPFYRAMFYVFIVDIVVLSYVGGQPATEAMALAGQAATLVYFGLFVLLPYMSVKEEAWLRKRGLPPAVVAMMASEAAQRAAARARR